MAVRVLAKLEWRAYFDRFSKDLIGGRAEVEIAGLAFGNRTALRDPRRVTEH